MRPPRRLVEAVVLGAIAAGVAAVPLPGGLPPVAEPSRLAGWWAGAGPVVGLYGGLRVAVVGVIAGWAGILAIRALADGTHVGAAVGVRLAERAAAGGRRAGGAGLLRVVLGLSATGAATTGCAVGVAHRSRPATMARAPGAAPAPVLIGPKAAAPPSPTPAAPEPTAAPRTTTPTRPPARAPATWTVRPGDDLWSIAATITTVRSCGLHPAGRAAGAPHCGDQAIESYWRALIAANEARLPVPSDPSLIFPGDVLVLP